MSSIVFVVASAGGHLLNISGNKSAAEYCCFFCFHRPLGRAVMDPYNSTTQQPFVKILKLKKTEGKQMNHTDEDTGT